MKDRDKNLFEEWMKKKDKHSLKLPAKKIFPPEDAKIQKNYGEEFINFVKNLPLYTPKDLYEKLEGKGYRGQERARRFVCVMAYRHIKRIKMIFEKGIPSYKLPPKINYLLIGPTGCGKTFIMELLFKEILNIPSLIVDITKYTETGYVGEDIGSIPFKLIELADGNKYLAQIGVVVFDEFDKIAGAQSTIRFAGAGTTKDVSGFGVQRELLKLLESGIYHSFLYERGKISSTIDTSNILFVASGAFSGINEIDNNKNTGFLKEIKDKDGNTIAYNIEKINAEYLQKFYGYGFLPELIARFQRIIPFEPLDKKTLKEIIDVKMEKIKNEFLEEGFEIEINQRAKDFIVSEAIRRQTGARAIESIIMDKLEEVAFDIFGNDKRGKIIIDRKDGDLEIKIKNKRG